MEAERAHPYLRWRCLTSTPAGNSIFPHNCSVCGRVHLSRFSFHFFYAGRKNHSPT